MLARIKHWLMPPVFLADPLKTRRADFLNIILLTTLGLAPVLIISNLLGGRTPAQVTALNLGLMLTTLAMRQAMRRGHVRAASIIMLAVSLIVVTLAAVSLGTIRTPTTTLYLVAIIMAGVLFDLTGMVTCTMISSLAVLGLIVAETSGWLPRPDYTVTVTQWVTYSVLFGSISLFSYIAVRRTRQALTRADRDLLERQRTEQALRQRDEQLREAQHLAQVGSWDWDLPTQQLTWSDEVYRIFGVAPGEFSPSAEIFEGFIHPDDRADFLSRRAHMLAETRATIIDHRIISRDGQVRWVQERAQTWLDEHGQTTRVTGTVQDITERKCAELAEHGQRMLAEALRDTAAALNNTLNLGEVFERILVNVERVVDHDTANLMLIDEQGVAHIVRHRGYAERGLTDFAARVHLTVSNVPNLQHMAETGQPRVMPDVRREPDWIDWPESHWIQSIASAPIWLKGQAIGFINLNSSTTNFYSTEHGERLRAFANQAAVAVENARLYEAVQHHAQTLEQRVQERTAELQIANVRLQELDRMKDEFMSRMSHELRTPLTSIKIYLELLETARPEKRDKYLKTLTREANRLHQLIEDVLTITQLSRATLDVEIDNADVNQLLESRLPAWREMAVRQALTFQTELAPALPPARLDRLYTLQVVTQLVTNATNYTPAGSVTLSTARVDELDGTWLTISVSDTGPGITPEDLPHIFERFYRGRAAADYKTPGTGVGLSISREIAEKLGGRLTMETRVGVGSTFTLWLPAADMAC